MSLAILAIVLMFVVVVLLVVLVFLQMRSFCTFMDREYGMTEVVNDCGLEKP